MDCSEAVCLDVDQIEALRTKPDFETVFSRYPRAVVVEHERVAFPSYPYEWSPEMFRRWQADDAACAIGPSTWFRHQGRHALQHTFPWSATGIRRRPLLRAKDARDPNLATICAVHPHVPAAPPGQQVFPDALDQIFLTRRDGLEPDDVYPYLSTRQKFLPPALQLVTMPVLLAQRSERSGEELYKPRKARNPELAKFVLESMFRRMERALDRLMPEARESRWSDYLTSNNNYAPEAFTAKERFVAEALSDIAPWRVLDVGCNTGHFSALAARAGQA